jgi:hypothetical protein
VPSKKYPVSVEKKSYGTYPTARRALRVAVSLAIEHAQTVQQVVIEEEPAGLETQITQG